MGDADRKYPDLYAAGVDETAAARLEVAKEKLRVAFETWIRFWIEEKEKVK